MRVWITALFAISALTAQSLPLVENPPSETSFRLSPVEFSYPGAYRSLRQVDFRNLLVNFIDGTLVPLKNGQFEGRDNGFESASFESVNYLPSAGYSNRQFALVLYTHISGGGSTSNNGVALVYELTQGHLKIVREITWDQHFTPPGNWSMRYSNGAVTVRAARYLEGDAHCCISGMDTVTLTWNGSRFSQTRMVTERIKP